MMRKFTEGSGDVARTRNTIGRHKKKLEHEGRERNAKVTKGVMQGQGITLDKECNSR